MLSQHEAVNTVLQYSLCNTDKSLLNRTDAELLADAESHAESLGSVGSSTSSADAELLALAGCTCRIACDTESRALAELLYANRTPNCLQIQNHLHLPNCLQIPNHLRLLNHALAELCRC